MAFDVAGYNAGIRALQECEAVPGIRMCDNSFRESTNEDLRQVAGDERRIRGTCNLCNQSVGAIFVRPGVVRINWHERAPVKKMSAGTGQADNGIPDEDF